MVDNESKQLYRLYAKSENANTGGGIFRALSTRHYRFAIYICSGRNIIHKWPSKCKLHGQILQDRRRLAAVFLACRCVVTIWARKRGLVGGLGNTGDSQQVLPTNLSVSGRLPRLMGIENFRLRTRDNSSLSRSRSWRPAYAVTVTCRPSARIYDVRTTTTTTTTTRISGERGWLRWIRCSRRRARRYEPIAGVGVGLSHTPRHPRMQSANEFTEACLCPPPSVPFDYPLRPSSGFSRS